MNEALAVLHRETARIGTDRTSVLRTLATMGSLV
jgi:hypothetical protein